MALPPSSPRLPSPPPPAEIQTTPNSPLMGPNATRQAAQIEQTAIDTNAKRRIHPGTKSADMAAGPPLVPLHELDSAFQLQEHLAALHYSYTEGHTTPINRETAKLLATPPPGIDKTLWLYELCRFLIAQCNSLIVGFLFDTPPCSAATCPEMRAGEWQFLCAVHDTPKSCCAIDYCCHTLDWAANVVTNPKIFPSRFVVDAHDKNTALKNLVNVFRRLHRIFAHAWFQHRGVFWSLESQSGLYVFFKTVCDVYDLLPAENYKLPPEAEGLDSNAGANDVPDRSAERRQQQQQLLAPIAIAKPPSQRDSEDGDYSAMSRNNTRRHIKSSPSTGSAVTTVPEADEDDGSDLSHRLRQMRIATARAEAEGDGDSANIPVIVEHRPLTTAEQPMRPSSVVPPPGATVFERQPASEQEPEPTKQEEPAPEHEFALEPEAPAPLPFRPKPEPESAEPVPESQLEPETKAEEEPSAAPVEDQHPPEEQPEPTTAAAAAAAAAAEEPAPETKAADVEEQEASSTVAAEEAGEKDSASSPVAENADETAAGAKASDTAEEKEVKDQTKEEEEEETKEKKTEEPVESTVQEAEALGSQGGAAEQEKEKEQEKEEETEAKAEPEAKAGSTKEEAEVVASPPEKEEKEEKETEKETDKKEEVEVMVAPKEEDKVEKKEEEEEEETPKEEGADTKEEAAPKEKQDDKAEEGKKTADEEKKSD